MFVRCTPGAYKFTELKEMHAVACHAIYGAGGRAGRVGKIKKVTEDCQENIRPLSRHVKEWEAAKNQAGRRKSHRRAHYLPLCKILT